MENDNKLVRNGCKKMHGVWIDTLAVKNGHGNGILYGLTIGGKSFANGSCKVMVVDMDLFLEIFMNLFVWRPIVHTM